MIPRQQVFAIVSLFVVLVAVAVLATRMNRNQPFEAAEQSEAEQEGVFMGFVEGVGSNSLQVRVKIHESEGIEQSYSVEVGPETIITELAPDQGPATFAEIEIGDQVTVTTVGPGTGLSRTARYITLFAND